MVQAKETRFFPLGSAEAAGLGAASAFCWSFFAFVRAATMARAASCAKEGQ